MSAAEAETVDEQVLPEADELAVELERLAEENRRLRRAFARTRRTRYRRTAAGLAGLGMVGLVGGYVFVDTRAVLWALGGTGLFGALLTWYLTPERFIAASVGESIYASLAANSRAMIDELGLTRTRLYLPVGTTPGSARLFVPQHTTYELPAPDRLDGRFVTEPDAARGLVLEPTGAALLEDFVADLAGPLADDAAVLLDQLTDGLVADLELVEKARPEVAEPGRLTVGVSGSAVGDLDRFDHPVVSFIGVGLAVGLDSPVQLDLVELESDRYDAVVVATWEETEPAQSSASEGSPAS